MNQQSKQKAKAAEKANARGVPIVSDWKLRVKLGLPVSRQGPKVYKRVNDRD